MPELKKLVVYFVLIVTVIFLSGCTGNVAKDRSSNFLYENCPPGLKESTIITVRNLDIEYLSDENVKKLSDYAYYTSLSICRDGSHSGERSDFYYCELVLKCYQLKEDDGTIKGYGKLKTIAEYEITDSILFKDYTKFKNYTKYNITLELKGCKTEAIINNTAYDCMVTNFSI